MRIFKGSFFTIFVLFCRVSFADYQPLVGSEWAKAHPGILPYEECHIVTYDNLKLNLLVVSRSNEQYSTYIRCSAKSLGLLYYIPISYMENKVERGIFLPWIMKMKLLNSVKLYHLDQKSLGDAMGKYCGFSIGGGIILGGEGVFLSNSQDAKIKGEAMTMIELLSIGSARLTLALNKVAPMNVCINPFVIVNGDTSSRDIKRDCVPNGPYDPSPPVTPVPTADVLALRFVKIKAK